METMHATIDEAFGSMLDAFRENQWFTHSYWPLNRDRVRMMLEDVVERTPSGGAVFEVGCGNGYIAYLLAQCGYRVTATDAWSPPERAGLFEAAGVEFFPSNLNALDPFEAISQTHSFDTIVLGEVIEHILNCPLNLMENLARLTRNGGTIIVTTPNACTLMNSVRMLLGSYSLWGAKKFITEPKIGPRGIIDDGDIHYREYTHMELQDLVRSAGYSTEPTKFYPCGVEPTQSLVKRAIKTAIYPLLHTRLLGAGQYVIGTKNPKSQ
jgi:2-polyprenyl-3-methyl-5-hydroxy-6-metoxy-1,4-benzoquinol methylase